MVRVCGFPGSRDLIIAIELALLPPRNFGGRNKVELIPSIPMRESPQTVNRLTTSPRAKLGSVEPRELDRH